MSVLLYIWLAITWLLLITGWVWTIFDKKGVRAKKTPWILIAVGSFMLAAFFLFFILMLNKV